jgi:hypothetical protein
LAIDSNNILGNLSITYQQNEFLTELFKKTMFSELLNWSGAGYNYSLIEDQITQVSFVNNYRNEAIELLLQYESTIETVQLAAQESAQVFLPSANVTYRIKSINTGEYLTEWEDLSGTEIDLGFYEETIPATPEDIRVEIKDWLMITLFATVAFLAMVGAYLKTKNDPVLGKPAEDRPAFGVSNTAGFYYGKSDRTKPSARAKSSALLIVIALIVGSFLIVYLAISYGVLI